MFLRRLPSYETVPRNFFASIGADERTCHCFRAGPIDCIPRNILVGDQDWWVIDHEWMLDEPVSVELVAYLGVSSLVFDLQESIQKSANLMGPVSIFAGRLRRFYAPVAWLEILEGLSLPIDLLNDWYFGFQKQNLVDASPRILRPARRSYSSIPGRFHPNALLSDIGALCRSVRRR